MPVLVIAFLTTLLAELGDKTQLVTLTLSSRYPPRQVLAGALSALAAITLIGVAVGRYLYQLLPQWVTLTAGGIFFLLVGVLMLLRRDGEKAEKKEAGRGVAVQTFAMVFLAELGDKTQLAAIALTAAYGAPFFVFLGAMGGQFINHVAAAYLGSRFLSRLPGRTVRIGSGILFIIFGVTFLFAARS